MVFDDCWVIKPCCDRDRVKLVLMTKKGSG